MLKKLSLNANELQELPTLQTKQMWGPSICLGNLVLLDGPRGLGKTRFVMKLGHTMATGGKFLKWRCDEPERLLYVDHEMGKFACARRWADIEKDEDCASVVGGRLHTLSFDMLTEIEPLNISSEADQQILTDEINSLDAKIVIIDNLLTGSRPLHSRDSDFTQWQRIEPWLRHLRSEQRTVILVHHTGKSGDQLGTSAKEVVMDTHIILRAPATLKNIRGLQFELSFKKTRDYFVTDTPPLFVTYEQDSDGVSRWRWEELANVKRLEALKLHQRGVSKREIASSLGLTLLQVVNYLEETRRA